MAEKKYSALAMLDILKENTDKDHPLTTKEIISLLEMKYGLLLERRTIYSNIELLKQAGYQISSYDENGVGFALEKKQFDKEEILLLCNALHATHFIPEEQTSKLIRKLLDTQSRFESADFINSVYLPNLAKTPNESLLRNIKKISDAIRMNKVIKFAYLTYNEKKELVPKREDPYFFEPRYIVYADERPYLLATSPKYDDFTHYRIDRMGNIEITGDDCRMLGKELDPYEYARTRLYMYSGQPLTVQFLCDNTALDHMIDLFGKDLTILKREDGKYLLFAKSSWDGAKLLAQQYMGHLQILTPEDLREEFADSLCTVLESYKESSR